MQYNPTPQEIELLLSGVSCRLELDGPIGQGGQKVVYKARNLDNNGDFVVFKVLKPTDDTLERVKREICAVEAIGHRYIPKILETNAHTITSPDELIWIVEQFVPGNTLRDILKSGKIFDLSEIVKFLDVMFSILEKSESLNIIHRDIKPENIIVDLVGDYWLIDFGISRHIDLESITITNAPYGLFTIGFSSREVLFPCFSIP